MNKQDIVEQYLRKEGSLTNIEIQQLVWTTCPHGLIRGIRRKYGYDCIKSQEHFKTRKYQDEKGKEHNEHIRWVEYIWNGEK